MGKNLLQGYSALEMGGEMHSSTALQPPDRIGSLHSVLWRQSRALMKNGGTIRETIRGKPPLIGQCSLFRSCHTSGGKTFTHGDGGFPREKEVCEFPAEKGTQWSSIKLGLKGTRWSRIGPILKFVCLISLTKEYFVGSF